MIHRFRSVFLRPILAFCVVAVLCTIMRAAYGQNLAFTPGLASTYAGDPTQSHAQSAATYSGPLSGLVLNRPDQATFDANGNAYVVDGNGIRVVASGKGAIPAAPAAGASPQAGYVYPVGGVTSVTRSGSTWYDSSCTTATDNWGDGCPATDVYFSTPYVAVDANGNIYVADGNASEIRVIYSTGSIPNLPQNPVAGDIYAIAGGGTSTADGPALSVELAQPGTVALDSSGNIYFSDTFNDAVRVLYVKGSIPGLPTTPTPGNVYTVAGTIGKDCTYSSSNTCGDGGPATAAMLDFYIGGVGIDPSGNIYVADRNNYMVRAVYVSGTLPGITDPQVGDIYAIAGTGSAYTGSTTSGTQATGYKLTGPSYVALDQAGDVYINNSNSPYEVYKVDPSGILTVVFGGASTVCAAATDSYGDGCAATAATLATPYGLAFDSSGNLYIADSQNSLIREANLASSAMSFSGTFGLTVPSQVLTVSNTGKQALALSDISAQAPFSQVPTSGSTDCGNTTSLQPGASCQIGVSVIPTQAGPATGNLQVSSNALNATSGVNTVSLSAVIAQAASSTTLTASPAAPEQVSPGQTVTFTATVVPQTGVSSIPTGTVSFNNGATPLGTATLNSSGVATFTTTSLAAGSYVVTAAYSGDTNFNTSTSNAASVTVASVSVPTVTLTASPTSATAGQSVTLTAVVTPPSGGAAPTGTIVFEDGVAQIGTATLSNGTATLSTTTLPAGANTLIAAYSGNLPSNDSNGVVVTVASQAQLQFAPGTISSIVDSIYKSGYSGDGGAATAAEMYDPQQTAIDPAGNLYFVDTVNNVVRVVASGKGSIPGIANPVAGDIYTFAGVQGQLCSTAPCGDGGPANQAYLYFAPSQYVQEEAGVAVDNAGDVYIADPGDDAIRKVTPDGTIKTVAGTLTPGNVYGSTSTGDGGPATSATLSVTLPGITIDNAGNLYIIDGDTVRKVDAQTQIITTVAGSQTAAGTYSGDGGPANAAGLDNPKSIAVDGQGNLYIADYGDQAVREVNARTGIISTVAGYDSGNPSNRLTGCAWSSNNCYQGDGGPATKALLYDPDGVTVDAAGNLYILDAGNSVVRMVDAQTGIINTIAGQGTVICSAAPCGDGGTATDATFEGLKSISLDSAGDFDIADTSNGAVNAIRQITAGSSALNFGSPNLGTIVGDSVTVTNTGAQPLTITGITASDGFTQGASGGMDCTASITLAPAEQCIIDVQFFPTTAKAYNGTLTVASNSSNAQGGNNTITLTGTGVANSGTQAQSISFPAPAAPYDEGMQIVLGATATSGLPVEYEVSGPGLILNNGTANAALKITGAGNITVTAYQFGDSTYAAATPVPVSFAAAQPVLTITASNESITQGNPVPAYTSASDYAVTGYIPGDSSASLSGQPSISVTDSSGNPVAVGSKPATGQYNLVITQGSLVAPSYYKLTFVNGLLTVTGSNPQTVVFQPLPANLTYGAAPITLNAVANDATSGKADGLSVTFSATPATDTITGNLLTIGEAGPLSVTATQAGSAYYATASATQSAVVAKAPLSVTANNQTLAQGIGLPSLNSSADYTFGQFQNQETAAVLTGAPSLVIVDGNGNVQAPGSTPPVGTYTIEITQGSLSSSNYSFNFVNGTFTVAKGKTQTVTFPSLPNLTYGAAPITLNASASSGLGVVYSVTSGPATIAGNMLSIHGAGTITVEASQPGNATYASASATQSFNVGPALLTVTADNVTRTNNVPNPPLTGYTITGFVNGDTQAVVSGSPALSTTAQPGSPVGTYPIVITAQPSNSSQNTIVAANYTFAFVNGVLTITPGGPAPDFSLTATPTVLGIPQGQLQQTTITLTPTNFYQGTAKLSCGNLPANMTCVFSPSALNPDGTGNPVTGTLTINTDAASPVVAQTSLRSGPEVFPAAALYLPGELVALVVAFYRKKRTKKSRAAQLLVMLILLTGTAALTACGGGSAGSKSPYTAPGSYTISLTAADSVSGVSHSINLAVDVQ